MMTNFYYLIFFYSKYIKYILCEHCMYLKTANGDRLYGSNSQSMLLDRVHIDKDV